MSKETGFGVWLKERRQALDLTQVQIAEQSGYTVEMIRKIEAGIRRPSEQGAQLMIGPLQVPAEQSATFIRFARGVVTAAPPLLATPAALAGQRPQRRLPALPTALIGREQESAQLSLLLTAPRPRLLTLTGMAGIGKTSLALAVAAEAADRFRDGVYFVPLAALTDPALVATTIARVLGLSATSERPPVEALHDYLWDKQVLLLLDNFEQIMAAAALVAEMLRMAPKLKILVTSRGVLRLRGEKEIALEPLEVPDSNSLPWLAQLGQCPAVRLFVERATEARDDFALTAQNAPVVADITRRLEGLPLALELAAARIRMLPPQELLARLASRLDVLDDGPVDLPPRQQTLRGAIAWSYDLLAPEEQRLLRRLGVFVGGCTLDAAEAVAGGQWTASGATVATNSGGVIAKSAPSTPPAARRTLDSLVRMSMLRLQHAEGPARYSMLETIREYALQLLAEHEEADELRAAYARYFLDLAERTADELSGPGQSQGLNLLEADHDNIRAVLSWSLAGGRLEIALRLVAALWRFWSIHGHLIEGRRWVEQTLTAFAAMAAGDAVDLTMLRPQHARTQSVAGILAWMQGDLAVARAYLEQGLLMYRELDDERGIASALNNLGLVVVDQGRYGEARTLYEEILRLERAAGTGTLTSKALINLGNVAQQQGHYAEARGLHEEALHISRAQGDIWLTVIAAHNLANAHYQLGDYATARQLHEEGLVTRSELGDKPGRAYALNSLGNVRYRQGDLAAGRALVEESLTLRRELDNQSGIALSLHDLAIMLLEERDYFAAAPLLRESLRIHQAAGARDRIARNLAALAGVAIGRGQPDRAALLFGAAAALREELDIPVPANERPRHERDLMETSAALGTHSLADRMAEGHAVPLEQVIELALHS